MGAAGVNARRLIAMPQQRATAACGETLDPGQGRLAVDPKFTWTSLRSRPLRSAPPNAAPQLPSANRRAQPPVGLPVHSSRLWGKWFGIAVSRTQAHSNLSAPSNPSQSQRFCLTIIGQAMAVATGENPTGGIQDSNSTTTVHAVGTRLTTKPRSAPTKGAWRPRDRDALDYDWSVLGLPTP